MKMAFFPGKLFLESKPDGSFELKFGEEVQSFRSEKQAIEAFRQIRTRLEKEFPARGPTLEERRALLHQEIVDTTIGHRTPAAPRKKTGTRTFG